VLKKWGISGSASAWCLVCFGLLVLLHTAAGGLTWFTPRFTNSIPGPGIAVEAGEAYVAAIHFDKPFPYELPADTPGAPYISRLVLLENGHVLGPPHALHADIRKFGSGRYSHWGDSIIFSSSDGSDPRTNGRLYSIASTTSLYFPLQLVLLAALLLGDGFFYVVFRDRIFVFLRPRTLFILGTIVVSMVAGAGLLALGAFGTVVVVENGAAKDTALVVHVVEHALLGCLVSVCVWLAGAGVVRLFLRNPHGSLAQILIPAFPASLLLLAALETISLAVPHGRAIALVLWIICLIPLFKWRPPPKELMAALRTMLGIAPFAIIFGTWLGLLWHGPTETLSGSPSGDLTSYAGSIWSLASRVYPLTDLGYENGATLGYFNHLFPALGAVLLSLPGFDPFLYLLASGGATYIVFSSLMLHFYLADRAPGSPGFLAVIVLLLSFLAAARYPYWVIESIPVVFIPALAMSIWWMAQRSQNDFRWALVAAVAAVSGSALSKVTSAAVLFPLSTSGIWRQFWSLPRSLRMTGYAVGCITLVYGLAMLSYFLPKFLSIANTGPESFQNPQWWFICRDISVVILALLAWLIVDAFAAFALTIGLLTFVLFSGVFQINFVIVTLLLGLIVFTGPASSSGVRLIALAAFALAFPAMLLSDPAGVSSSLLWIACLGGSILIVVSNPVRDGDQLFPQSFRMYVAIAISTLSIGGLGLVGVARGYVIVDFDRHFLGPQLTPELKDIWSAVRRLTPPDALVFTDQVDETINVLGGWNTFALSGQRQIYLSSYYTSAELRSDKTRLREVLAVNEAVLNGSRSPFQVQTRGHYKSAYAVVSNSVVSRSNWIKIYANSEYALFQITP
jgi:hypothetical protein